MSIHVLVTDNDLGDSALEAALLREHLDCEVFVRNCRTEAEVLNAVRETEPHAIIVQWAPVTAAVLEAASRCRVISRIGIGLDMIDLDEAARRSIAVRNVPHYCVEEVATHAVALALALWRRLPAFDREVREHSWSASTSATAIRRLSDSTVGLIGMGRIGRLVADAFAAWGARVIVHDPVKGEDPYARVDLPTIAADADLITLHAPLLETTHHLVGADFLESLARRPYIVNVSRGALVDTAALADALASGRVGGAGLDVFETEPLPADDPMRSAPNTLLTPHAAWCSDSALPELRRTAALNVVDALGMR